MTYLPAEAHARFAEQHGVASIDQLTDTGLTVRQIEYLVEQHCLVNVVRGTYASPSVALTETSRLVAICLARPHVVVAGPTAGRVHGLRKVGHDRRIHLLAPPGANPAVGRNVKTFHTRAFGESDIEHRNDGLRVTTMARTSLDLARHLSADPLLSVVEQVMQRTRLSDEDLRAMALPWLPRRRWVHWFIETLNRRIVGPAAESDPEVVVGQMLDSRCVVGLVRQFAVDLPGYGPARFDLAVPEIRWALEVDVFPTHGEILGIESDRRRDEAARRTDWNVNRINRNDYQCDLVGSIDRVVASYHHCREHTAVT